MRIQLFATVLAFLISVGLASRLVSANPAVESEIASYLPIKLSEIQSPLPTPQRWPGRIQFFKSTERELQGLLTALKVPEQQRTLDQRDSIQVSIQNLALASREAPAGWTHHYEKDGVINQGMNTEGHVYAGVFVIENDGSVSEEIVIENNTSYIQALTLFEISELKKKPVYLGRSGLATLDGPAALREKTAAFSTVLPANSRSVYVFLYEGHVMQMELQFFTKYNLANYLRSEEKLIFLAVGFLFCVFCYNFFLWIAFRDPLYLWYTGFASMTLTFVLGMSGVLPSFLRDALQVQGDLSFIIVYPAYGMMLLGIAFGDQFNQTLQFHPKIRYLRNIISLLLLTNFPLYILAPRVANQIQSVLTNAFIFYVLYGAIKGIARGNFASRIFLLSWCGYLFSGIINTLSYKGMLAPSFWIEWGTTIGLVFEGIGLSIAISFRLKRQEEDLNRELQNAMQAKVLLTNELVHRTTQPLRKIVRAVDAIKQDLKSLDDNLISKWGGLRGEHIVIAQHEHSKVHHILHNIREIETGITHTEHTIEDIYALSSPHQNMSQGASFKECWRQLLLRLGDSSMRADLERLKVQEEDFPKLEIHTNPVILNLALEMIFKLWLATGQSNLFISFGHERSESGDELLIRVVKPFTPIAKDLLEELAKHINYILYPYGMQMEMSPSGWELKICLYLSETQRWRQLRSV